MAKQERARRTRERVLTAAAEVFAAQGYSRATLDAVAERIGMTKGALYGHFPSKRSLAGALIDESQQTWTRLRTEYDTPGADAGGVLQGVVVGFAGRLESDVRLRAAVRLASDCPVLARAVSDVLVEVCNALTELVRRAQRDGGLPAYSPRLVAQLLMVVMYGLLHAPAGCAEDGGASGGETLWRLLFTALSGTAGAGPAHEDEGAVPGPKTIPLGTNLLTAAPARRGQAGRTRPCVTQGNDMWEEADERAGRVDEPTCRAARGPRCAGTGPEG
ncbi:TetR family transcriptional regulator [Streptomyces sp. NPDC100445]|uniref:TetR family transcriptional regulator n=1 Tax=Streptomyces sp. NPDC100445 TaxID=3366102 RepID=UPI0037F9FA48